MDQIETVEFAKKYLEDLLTFFDLNLEVEVKIEDGIVIADYKKQHAEKIIEKARGWIEEVRRTGESKIVNLNAADRWTVHHLASEYSDIETHSEGEGRDRQLIISQKSS